MKTIRCTDTLFYYDGPQILEARDTIGRHYLVVMVDVHNGQDRCLVVGVTRERLKHFRAGAIELKSLMLDAGSEEWYLATVTNLDGPLVIEPQRTPIAESKLLPDDGFLLSDRRVGRVANAAEGLRRDMERLSLDIRDLVLSQPPIQFLAYLRAQFFMGVLADSKKKEEDYRPDKQLVDTFQFALEYVHAVWSCHSQLVENEAPLDQDKATTFFKSLKELKNKTTAYCIGSSASSTEFHAKSSWALIRGNRYQVLEDEFFNFVLEPHADALRSVYGMNTNAIAAAIQAIADAMRTGFSDAILKIQDGQDNAAALMRSTGVGLGTAIKKLTETDCKFATETSNAMHDMLSAGTCSLSRHTNLTSPLLDDLSYTPGENTEFFAEGDFKGTPMRTLPGRIKPGIKLGDEYYVTDGQFIRDAAYRAIQRGLLDRLPSYREDWNRRQKTLIEQSFRMILEQQFSGAVTFSEVYFKDPKSGQWTETDLLMAVDDVLLVIEAKAGVMAMHSPATNYARHERAITELITKAYGQCKRFVEYLASTSEIELYGLVDGRHVEIGRLRQRDYRTILPIGLTVEAFAPFSAMCKELKVIRPLLGKHPFISMSVDDLFVLNRFLPTTGELCHYLEVRQQVAGIPNAVLFDEIDHLGAYIKKNRFDIDIRQQLKEVDMVTWDSFCDLIDEYFEGDTWKTAAVPHQEYPEELAAVLGAIDKFRPAGWLEIDSHLRDLDHSSRNNLANVITELRATLPIHPIRRLLFGEEKPIQIWLCRGEIQPPPHETRRQGEVSCITVNAPRVIVLRLSYGENGRIVGLACFSFTKPPVTQSNYTDLKREARGQFARRVELKQRKPTE